MAMIMPQPLISISYPKKAFAMRWCVFAADSRGVFCIFDLAIQTMYRAQKDTIVGEWVLQRVIKRIELA